MDSLLRSEVLRNRQKQMLHPLAKWQGDSVSKKWQMPLFRGSKFGQPEVARICKELILQAKSTTQQGAVFPQGKTAVAKRLGFSFEKPTVRRQSRLTRRKVRGAAAPPTPPEGFLTVWGASPPIGDGEAPLHGASIRRYQYPLVFSTVRD